MAPEGGVCLLLNTETVSIRMSTAARSLDGVDTASLPPVRTFKPRRRSLSAARQAWVSEQLARWGLAESGARLDLTEVFGRTAPVVLDVGVGGGEATVVLARQRPHEDTIAVDVHTPGISQVLAAIDADGLTNLRVVHGDALVFLDRLAPASLAGIRVWFPDPWPKARHRHRRLVQPTTVAALVDRLAVGGVLHLATDVDDYAVQMMSVCAREPRLVGGVVERPAWRPVTRFEARGAREGRTAVDLLYERHR